MSLELKKQINIETDQEAYFETFKKKKKNG